MTHSEFCEIAMDTSVAKAQAALVNPEDFETHEGQFRLTLGSAPAHLRDGRPTRIPSIQPMLARR